MLKKGPKEKQEQIMKLEPIIERKDLQIHDLKDKSCTNFGKLGAASKHLTGIQRHKLEERNGDDDP